MQPPRCGATTGISTGLPTSNEEHGGSLSSAGAPCWSSREIHGPPDGPAIVGAFVKASLTAGQ